MLLDVLTLWLLGLSIGGCTICWPPLLRHLETRRIRAAYHQAAATGRVTVIPEPPPRVSCGRCGAVFSGRGALCHCGEPAIVPGAVLPLTKTRWRELEGQLREIDAQIRRHHMARLSPPKSMIAERRAIYRALQLAVTSPDDDW